MAGRLRDRLAAKFGSRNVFIDVDSVPLGVDFRDHIRAAIQACDVVLAVIGEEWHGPQVQGLDRILDEADPVRLELEAAIAAKLPLIPVLIDGARLPNPERLPSSLSQLPFINAAHVESGVDFNMHVERLVRALAGVASGQSSPHLSRSGGTTRNAKRWAFICVVLLTVVVGVTMALREAWLSDQKFDVLGIVADDVAAAIAAQGVVDADNIRGAAPLTAIRRSPDAGNPEFCDALQEVIAALPTLVDISGPQWTAAGAEYMYQPTVGLPGHNMCYVMSVGRASYACHTNTDDISYQTVLDWIGSCLDGSWTATLKGNRIQWSYRFTGAEGLVMLDVQKRNLRGVGGYYTVVAPLDWDQPIPRE